VSASIWPDDSSRQTPRRELVRHHQLLELFLHDVLKHSLDEVHEEAERLEHFISERFEIASPLSWAT
jgi:hypothetical protein